MNVNFTGTNSCSRLKQQLPSYFVRSFTGLFERSFGLLCFVGKSVKSYTRLRLLLLMAVPATQSYVLVALSVPFTSS